MKKKIRQFASPERVVLIMVGVFTWILAVLFMFLTSGFDLFFFIIMIIVTITFFLLQFIIQKNAFQIFEINETGIKNRSISFKWDEITNFRIINLNLFSKLAIPISIPISSVIVFGKSVDEKFRHQDITSCVIVNVNKKTLAYLQKYGKEKSEGIRLLFEENIFD